MAILPRIAIITTGGTIASREYGGISSGEQLVRTIPKLMEYAQMEIHHFSSLSSSKMTPDHWVRLRKMILDLLKHPSQMEGVVVTHGTDTMEETAFFLSISTDLGKPIILTGAMRNADEISADGPGNLTQAVRLAVDPRAQQQGVMVLFNENIYCGLDVQKMNNRRVETFESREGRLLGVVDPDRIQFYGKRNSEGNAFWQNVQEPLPKVDLISDFTGFDPAILDFFRSRKPDGLVVQSFAGGRLSSGMEDGLRRWSHDIPLVIASKIPMGRIIGRPNPELPAIYASHLTAAKARILLMGAIQMHLKGEELTALFL